MGHDVSDFQRDVIERSATIPVLVDFWADWCGPCRILGPALERMADRSNGAWVLAKVDTEAFPDVAARYNIRSIPAVKLFVDGTVVNEFVGALPEPAIADWLRKSLPKKQNPGIEAARALLQDLKLKDAAPLLEAALEAEPDSVEARILLAKALLFADPERSRQVVDALDHGADHHELLEALRTLHALGTLTASGSLPDGASRDAFRSAVADLLDGRYDEALAQLIAIIREDRYYADDAARRAGIAIFKFLGEDHPITLKHRREFNSALFR